MTLSIKDKELLFDLAKVLFEHNACIDISLDRDCNGQSINIDILRGEANIRTSLAKNLVDEGLNPVNYESVMRKVLHE